MANRNSLWRFALSLVARAFFLIFGSLGAFMHTAHAQVVTEFSNGITAGGPRGITLGPDGNLWFIEVFGRIARITPSGLITEFSEGISRYVTLNDIAAGADGNLWFTEVASYLGVIGI